MHAGMRRKRARQNPLLNLMRNQQLAANALFLQQTLRVFDVLNRNRRAVAQGFQQVNIVLLKFPAMLLIHDLHHAEQLFIENQRNGDHRARHKAGLLVKLAEMPLIVLDVHRHVNRARLRDIADNSLADRHSEAENAAVFRPLANAADQLRLSVIQQEN